MPRLAIDKPYAFHDENGQLSLLDLFGGKSQLIVFHFMYGENWEAGCPSCSFWADNFDGIDVHLIRTVFVDVDSRVASRHGEPRIRVAIPAADDPFQRARKRPQSSQLTLSTGRSGLRYSLGFSSPTASQAACVHGVSASQKPRGSSTSCWVSSSCSGSGPAARRSSSPTRSAHGSRPCATSRLSMP